MHVTVPALLLYFASQIVAPRKFSLVCFRLKPPAGDRDNGRALNAALLESVNESGKFFFTHTVSCITCYFGRVSGVSV